MGNQRRREIETTIVMGNQRRREIETGSLHQTKTVTTKKNKKAVKIFSDRQGFIGTVSLEWAAGDAKIRHLNFE
jgi:hypothetical protein